MAAPTIDQVNSYNIWNIAKFLAFMMPHSIVIFFVMLSIFNSNFKGLFYLGGLIAVQALLNLTHSTNAHSAIPHKVCTIFNSNLQYFDIPAYSVSTLTYTLAPIGIVTGIMLGLFVGFVWALVTSTIDADQLYFSEYISDKVACSVPSKQAFKCNVYKNGELISQL